MLKVMLVDDESKVREAIRHQVPWDDLEISLIGSCSNAIEALQEMTEEMPDILITDIKMPVMSGIELIGRAKAMYPLIQCIVISGYDEFPLAQAAMSEGVRYYLLKPCMKDDVVNVLQKCIAQIVKAKKEVLSRCENRNAMVDKLVWDLNSLTTEDGERECREQLKQLMEYYEEDKGLLREAAVALVVKYWPEGESQKAMNIIGKLYDDYDNLYDQTVQLLLKKRKMIPEDDSFITRVKRYVDEHFDESNLTLQYVADHVVNMDAKYVGRKFCQRQGIKFKEYLLEVRIEHAIRMLLSTNDYKMYEIAEAVGLGNNVQYFYQLFKRYTGMTPKEYREKQKHLFG